jgi:sulfate transport system ATP-binding protein
VAHVLAVGPLVRLELTRDDGTAGVIQAEISRERYGQLKIAAGDRVFVRPRRADLFPGRIH